VLRFLRSPEEILPGEGGWLDAAGAGSVRLAVNKLEGEAGRRKAVSTAGAYTRPLFGSA